MATLKRPNLEAEETGGLDPFIAVRKDRQSVRISQSAVSRLGYNEGDYLHLAFDRGRQPLIAMIGEQTAQGEPQICVYDHTYRAYSALLCTHLVSAAYGDTDESIRFYLDGKTVEDEETGATLHRLKVPSV